ncbi:MAG: heme-binding domain-containing protein [Bacteroidota bacterium]|nr:heme-binding domain-containing protein [Bacteroidota bacterium]
MKRKIIKNTALGILVVLALIQFIHPEKNLGESLGANDIQHVINVPEPVMRVLKTSCFDCHSNRTNYPWYNNIQPIAFWMEDHVKEAKKELNFSEFAGYTRKRQLKKMVEIGKEITEEEMPLPSYLIIHRDAVLTTEQAELLKTWAEQSHAELKSRPEESYKSDSTVIRASN